MSKLSDFLELLKAPLKIISHNGKPMVITATVYLTLYAISFILYMLSVNPFILDFTRNLMALASTRPGTPKWITLLVAIREDIGIFLGLEAAFVVWFFFVLLFAQTTVVIIASCYYTGYDLSLKQLILKVSKTWTRPFVTSIWIQLLALGYTSFFLLPFIVPSLVLFDHRRVLIAILIILAVLFITLYVYLSVVWSVAVVVSVVEDSYGFSALSKAKELVKGKRVHGFLLSFVLFLVTMVILIIGFKLSHVMPIVVGVVQMLLLGVIGMFKSMAYSGFYFMGKNDMKSGGLKYSKIPTTAPVVDEDLP